VLIETRYLKNKGTEFQSASINTTSPITATSTTALYTLPKTDLKPKNEFEDDTFFGLLPKLYIIINYLLINYINLF